MEHESGYVNERQESSWRQVLIDELGLEKKEGGFFVVRGISQISGEDGFSELQLDILTKSLEGFSLVPSEPVVRPLTDTTLFTTSGVQCIETMLLNGESIKDHRLIVFQPVLRSQFVDSAKEGYSSSFFNLSIIKTEGTIEDTVGISRILLSAIAQHTAVSAGDVQVTIEENDAAWSDRRFKNIVISFSLRGIEIGECVFISDFPVSENEKINIVDAGLGLERFNWALKGEDSHYFSQYEDVYASVMRQGFTSDDVAKIIDPIRSMTLIALEGVEPSNKNQGYRLRQLSKRLIERGHQVSFDTERVIRTAYTDWLRWGHYAVRDVEEVIRLIRQENDRNFNRLVLNLIREETGKDWQININQAASSFLTQLRFSVDGETINMVIKNTKYAI